MKKYGFFISIFLFACSVVWARGDGGQNIQLNKQIEQAVANSARGPADSEENVLTEWNLDKEAVRKMMLFPQNKQDFKRAGLVFGRLIPVMHSYNVLHKSDAKAARQVGAVIAGEELVFKDDTRAGVVEFIEQYYQSITIPALAQEFLEFKKHIYQDMLPVQ